MMKKLILSVIVICFVNILLGAQTRDVFNQNVTPSSIMKPTLKVSCVRDLNYWKQPNLRNFWSWMPKLQFAVSGPIEDASYFTYEFFTPDGKLWFSQDSAPFAVAEGSFAGFESEAVKNWTDKRSSIATGVFSFKITLKNSLQNTSKLLYQGKFTVKKEFAGTPHPDFKNQNIFYVDQDWTLPMAYLNFNNREDVEAPIFMVSMWFRGMNTGKLGGYLFYNGKKIAVAEDGSIGQTNYVIAEGDSDNKFRWEQQTFNFYAVRYFDNDGNYKGRHVLRKNPGNYEIKVLLDGELVRTVAFTVGADGKIVDNLIAKNSQIGGFGYIFPAKIIPLKEGAINLTAYKTDAFYGNVLSGL